jgi:maltose alpha-D-glucosyltransferase/alpha-amylase
MQKTPLNDDPLWFKDAVIYEVPVRAFGDSDADGIGDFRGLTEKLDYIQDLGVTAIWILPFFPSPLRDDGYDISDYTSVNSIYGNLEDFQAFLDAAHQRGIRVIIELIINHTSDQHPWFQRARKAPPGSPERDFYVWSDNPQKYKGVRIIFKDFETSNWTWDPVAQSYYWHRFYSHQPDLNFEHPELQRALFDVADFWLSMGVDGMRLDAIPYLYEREGTICENLPETHAFLKKLRQYVDENYPNRMLLAEANQWPEDAAEYYGRGDECHMNFHFPLMPRLFMSLQMEDSFPIIDILQQTPQIPDNCQWALFLRNHDELTLEMVSDEDRDYMYRVYAQDPQARINLGIRRRLAPLLGNNRRRIELMNCLLMALPGTPVLYYGDEIGMGDNIYLGDRNGVRTPMQWSGDRNAGFSRANPQKLYLPVIVDPEYHYETVNVEAQRANPNSLWWWMKRLLAIRSRHRAFGRGTFELLYPENRKVLAFTRTHHDEHILVVANLSRFVQTVELDLSAFKGMVPVEIFGRCEFPAIDDKPYFLSLGPHAFFWFTIQVPQGQAAIQPMKQPTTIAVNGDWRDAFLKAEAKKSLETALPAYLRSCHWFGNRARLIQNATIVDAIPIEPPLELSDSPYPPVAPSPYYLLLTRIDYTEGMPEICVLPIAYTEGTVEPGQAIVYLEGRTSSGVLYDAMHQRDFLSIPLAAITHKSQFRGIAGDVVAVQAEAFAQIAATPTHPGSSFSLEPHLLRGERSNAIVSYGDRFILKLYRKTDQCINPDLEIGQFLTRTSASIGLPNPENFAPVAGWLEYRRKGSEPMTIGLLMKTIPEARDAWSYTLDSMRDWFDNILTLPMEQTKLIFPAESIEEALKQDVPDLAHKTMSGYLLAAELLGRRTAELHLALASDSSHPGFVPEDFTAFYQRSIYQYMRNQAGQVLLDLKKHLSQLPEDLQRQAQLVLNYREQLLGRFRSVIDQPITTLRMRCHGNYHLEEVLYTGKDFVVVDFEGEPTRPLTERRMKRSPLRDVAGMLQSFYYASQIALRREVETGLIRNESLPAMQEWTRFFCAWTSITFLKSYLERVDHAPFLPQTYTEMQILLDAYLLEKSVYEVGYELSNRPDWVEIPLRRVLELMRLER